MVKTRGTARWTVRESREFQTQDAPRGLNGGLMAPAETRLAAVVPFYRFDAPRGLNGGLMAPAETRLAAVVPFYRFFFGGGFPY